MLTYVMESASLSQHDLHRLEAFHSKALRKMHRIPATFYTKISEPTQPTTTNQQLREQTSQPPLTHHIHKAQLKLFGQILRAQDKCLERDCCFTKAFIYRSGTPGDGLRKGRPRTHWAEQALLGIGSKNSTPILHRHILISLLHIYIFTGWLPVATVGAS